MTKAEREKLEYKSLFTDERYAKKAWKEIIGASLQSPAAPLPEFLDKNGNVSPQSEIDLMAYNNIKARLVREGKDREPMQAEMMVECAILRSRLDSNTLNLLLERTAGKVKDEISVNTSQYEELSDEELELLAANRMKAKLLESRNENNSGTTGKI